MTYTLNAAGQAAIVAKLKAVGSKDRPWGTFEQIERQFNHSNGQWHICGDHGSDVIHIESAWFDTAPEPATFDEVVAMLRRLVNNDVLPCGEPYKRSWRGMVVELLARCPKV